jgi:hypothetical protein
VAWTRPQNTGAYERALADRKAGPGLPGERAAPGAGLISQAPDLANAVLSPPPWLPVESLGELMRHASVRLAAVVLTVGLAARIEQ